MFKKDKLGIWVLSVVLLCIVGVLAWHFLKTPKPYSIITLDINPSVEIQLNKYDEVINVLPLNEDAKEVISDDLKGKHINDALDIITTNVIDKGFAKDAVTIILYTDGIDNESVKETLRKSFDERQIQVDVIMVDNITEEDKSIAEKYGISEGKAAYINEVSKEQENISVESSVETPVRELEEAKERGVYCDEGYTLEGDFCVKEIGREGLKEGKICPQDYFEYDGKCYEQVEGTTTDKLVCLTGESLEDGKCYSRETINAIAAKTECTKGEEKTKGELGIQNKEGTDANEKVCVDLSKATHPVSPCELNDGTEWKRANGKCYWHRAGLLPSGCPGKIRVGNECWDDASNVLICKGARDGKQYKSRSDYCENSIKIIEPTVTEYRCEDDFILDGNKCKRETIHDTHLEKICPSGYTLLDSGQCINKKKTTNKIDGSYCEHPDAKREGNECIIYEIIDAKR